jgi:hypothetical protein
LYLVRRNYSGVGLPWPDSVEGFIVAAKLEKSRRFCREYGGQREMESWRAALADIAPIPPGQFAPPKTVKQW